MEQKVRPLGDRVAIKEDAVEKETEGGLLLAGSAVEKPLKGVIVAIGAGLPKKPMETKVGDRVAYGKYAGIKLEVDGETFLVMKESELIAVIN